MVYATLIDAMSTDAEDVVADVQDNCLSGWEDNRARWYAALISVVEAVRETESSL